MKKIIAFSESDASTGLGHLVRTSQVISCLNVEHFSVDFYCDYENIPKWFSSIDHNRLDIESFFNLDFDCYDLLIYDSYKNRNRLSEIRIKKLVIDDFNFYKTEEFVDVILDWNLGSGAEYYSNSNIISGTNYFPIGENTFPEYIKNNSWSKKSKNILASFGGVSDDSLIDIKKFIDLGLKFGDVYLMDPVSKLNNFKKDRVFLIQNTSLSEVLSKNEFLFGIIAGGTTKYILGAYGIPSLLISRNKLEGIAVDNFMKSNLSIDSSLLEMGYKKEHILNELEKVNKNLRTVVNKGNAQRLSEAILSL